MFAQLVIGVSKYRLTGGFFTLPAKAVLSSHRSADSLALGQLQTDLKRRLSITAAITYNAFGPAAVRICRDLAVKNPEGYRIQIRPDGITLAASTGAGAFYAVQTLRELIALCGRKLPTCIIEDAPAFKRRGVYHDCSRGKVPTLQTLKQLVERLAHWKINELQLYIENVFTFTRHPDIGKGFSPFTPDEILALQQHCQQYHIRLVGSLASFGHMEKILSLPPYQHLGEMPGFRGLPGGTTLCPSDPGSIKLIGELYDEFIPLFEADDFNVCCDETWELGNGRSQKRCQKHGTGKVYLDFLLKIHALCEKHGKRMNAWADILLKHPDCLDQLPRDIVLLNWEYEQNGPNIKRTSEIAKARLDFMVCPGTSSWLTHGTRLPNAMQNVKAFARQGLRHGTEGLLNTDWGDQGHRNALGVSLHGFAHAAAHAWNTNAVNNEAFTENFCRQTFGPSAKSMAKALTTLGSTYQTCGETRPNKSLLFEAMTEPLIHRTTPDFSAIDAMTETGLNKVIRQLSSKNLWPRTPTGLDEFERIALDELKLAARMDCLAAERALIAKAIRNGKSVTKTQLIRLASQMDRIATQFQSLWLKRNKRSRLADNKRLLAKTSRRMIQYTKKM